MLITLTTQLCINIIERCIVFLLLMLFTFPEHQSCHSQRMLGNQWKTNLSHLGVIHIDLSLLLDNHQLPNSLMRPCGHRNAKNTHTIFLHFHCQCIQIVCYLLFLYNGFSNTQIIDSVFVDYVCETSSLVPREILRSEDH